MKIRTHIRPAGRAAVRVSPRIISALLCALMLLPLLIGCTDNGAGGDGTTAPVTPVDTTTDGITDADPTTVEITTEITTDVPNTTHMPVTTQTSVTTQIPVTTQVPVTTQIPVTTQAPVTTQTPVTTEAPPTTTEEATSKVQNPEYTALNYADVKAMWLSQYDLNSVYTLNGAQRSEASYKSYIKTILSKVKDNGINTVIVQVRPNADSMYPSDFYTDSAYVVGKYGRAATYDAFKILIDEAHAIGLSVHAWINPLRCMLATEITLLDNKYPLKQWYNDTTKRGKFIVLNSNRYYLNPAYPETRQLIIDGANEILMKYEVDGLHMDDYFYPTTDASFDSAAYAAYRSGGGTLGLADFRRDALNKLVSGLYSATKAVSSSILFGISPAGNINTVYNSQYADVYRWCANPGYIDYICPQVYFGLEHQNYDFVKVCNTWRDIIKTDGVELIIGMTLGKAKSGTDQYAGTGKTEWAEHKDILYRCLQYTETLDRCTGVAYFCYQYFYNPTSGVSVTETSQERALFVPLLKTISWTNKPGQTRG